MIHADNDLVGLTATASDLFPPEVSVAAVDPRIPQPSVLPEEAGAIVNAVQPRQREFAAGRDAARQAMARLGLGDRAVPMGADRAPIWPEGVVGSISHTKTHCAAVAASGDHIESLGLDLEDDTPLNPDLWDEVCTPAETAWLAEQPEAGRGRLAKLIFSAKECAYKCQYPLTGKHLSFHDASIRLSLNDSTFEVVFNRDVIPTHANRLRGSYRRGNGLLVVGVVLRQPAESKGNEGS